MIPMNSGPIKVAFVTVVVIGTIVALSLLGERSWWKALTLTLGSLFIIGNSFFWSLYLSKRNLPWFQEFLYLFLVGLLIFLGGPFLISSVNAARPAVDFLGWEYSIAAITGSLLYAFVVSRKKKHDVTKTSTT